MKMKHFPIIAITLLVLGFLTACEKHDTLGDRVFAGKMVPHVYWELPSTTVNAGDTVVFSAQYYTTGSRPIDHLEVWYNTVEVEDKQAAAPWVTGAVKSFSIVSSATVIRRPEQSSGVMYDHNEAWWNEKERAYQFTASFPTSSTLSLTKWSNTEWDSTLVIRYFGETFMQEFKDSLETLLKKDVDKSYGDYRALFLAKGGSDREWIANYTDSTWNDNSQTYDKHFKNHTLPDDIDALYKSCGFGDLINKSGEYSISYSKQYFLNAHLRCYDDQGNYGMTTPLKEITLN